MDAAVTIALIGVCYAKLLSSKSAWMLILSSPLTLQVLHLKSLSQRRKGAEFKKVTVTHAHTFAVLALDKISQNPHTTHRLAKKANKSLDQRSISMLNLKRGSPFSVLTLRRHFSILY
jgi:hypothetical protein